MHLQVKVGLVLHEEQEEKIRGHMLSHPQEKVDVYLRIPACPTVVHRVLYP
jgi:hypothetical protein